MKLRVAIFAPVLTTGGTQRHLQQVLGGLDRRRFDVTLYTLHTGGEVADELLGAGFRIRALDGGPRMSWLATGLAVLRAARMLRADAVDVVHGYQWRPALVGALAARLAGVRTVVASKRSLSGTNRSERRAWPWIGRLADVVTVNASAIRDEAVAQGVRATWVVLRNGIDVARFMVPGQDAAQAKRAVGLDPRHPVVGTVGRIEGRKGHDVLVDAIARFRGAAGGSGVQLLIVGDGPARGEVEAQAHASGMGAAVRFTGTVQDVRPYLAAMDVFVLPSREEGSSNAVLEAMAAGCPVVATDVGGNAEVVVDGRTGMLVPSNDASALAQAIERLIEDGDLAHRLAGAGRALVERSYDTQRMVADLEALYRRHATGVPGAPLVAAEEDPA